MHVLPHHRHVPTHASFSDGCIYRYRVQVFPTAPHAWDDGVVFYRLRAMRAFLVSAHMVKKELQWMQIESLAGAQPVVVSAPFANADVSTIHVVCAPAADCNVTLEQVSDSPLTVEIHGLKAGAVATYHCHCGIALVGTGICMFMSTHTVEPTNHPYGVHCASAPYTMHR